MAGFFSGQIKMSIGIGGPSTRNNSGRATQTAWPCPVSLALAHNSARLSTARARYSCSRDRSFSDLLHTESFEGLESYDNSDSNTDSPSKDHEAMLSPSSWSNERVYKWRGHEPSNLPFRSVTHQKCTLVVMRFPQQMPPGWFRLWRSVGTVII